MTSSYKVQNDEAILEKRTSISKSVKSGAESPSDVVDIPSALPPPPDGGWGWVVVFASFMICLIADGIIYSFSPSLIVFADHFNESQGKVAWISSLMCGSSLICGPIASALVNKYGCRPVAIAGSIIASAAYASTILATSVLYLMIVQGVIAGFGFGLLFLPAVICVGSYFEKRRAIAMGLAFCGTGIGTIVFPPLAKILIQKLGWKKYHLVVSGMLLFLSFMAALMRPLEVAKMKKKTLLQRIRKEKKVAKEIGSVYGSTFCFIGPAIAESIQKSIGNVATFSVAAPNNIPNLTTIQEEEEPMEEPLTEEGIVAELEARAAETDEDVSKEMNRLIRTIQEQSEENEEKEETVESEQAVKDESIASQATVTAIERNLTTMDLLSLINIVPGTTESEYTNLGPTASNMDPEDVIDLNPEEEEEVDTIPLPPLARQDIFYAGEIKELDEFKDQGTMVSYRESTYNLQELASRAVMEVLEPIDQAAVVKPSKCALWCSHLTSLIDFSLLKNPVFLMLCFANLIGILGFYAPFIYLPAAAIDKGVDQSMTGLLISIIGISGTIGRLMSGFIGSIPKVNTLYVSITCIFTAALSVAGIPFAYAFEGYTMICLSFGFSTAIFSCLTSIVLVDLVGLRNLTNAYGLLLLFKGIAAVFGPPLAGIIYDLTSSYSASFFVSGLLLFIWASMYCFVPLAIRCAPKPPPVVLYHTNEDYLQAIAEEDEELESLDNEEAGLIMSSNKSTPKLAFCDVDKEKQF